jgi:amino acid transporter
MQDSQSPHLIRTLGRWDLTAISLNTIIGSGIFLLPATVASLVGVWAPLTFVVSGLLSLVFALSFAEAAGRFTETGGPYTYARAAFGDFVGFEVAWMFWASRLSAAAAAYNVTLTYLGHFVPSLTEGLHRILVLTALVAVVAYVNIRGVKLGSFFTNLFTVAKLLPLLALMVAGLLMLEWSEAIPAQPFSLDEFLRGVLVVAFAFGGFEVSSVPAGEARDPRKHLPFALLVSVAVSMVLYMLLQFVAFGLHPSLGTSQRPLADAATGLIGASGGTLISLGALISTTGYVLGASLVVPRVTYALAEQGQFPRSFANIHARFQTPWVSILFHALVSWILAAGLSFFSLIIINVLARLVVIGITCAAVLKFRRKAPEGSSFRLPGGSGAPVAGLLLAIALFFQSSLTELMYGGLAILAGSLMYIPLRRRASRS